MLGKATLTTTEQTIYTVPEGKRASVAIVLCNTSSDSTAEVTVKVSGDELLMVELQPKETFQFTQLILDAEDTVSASASIDNTVKLFVSGVEE
jgi:hypothetical protein